MAGHGRTRIPDIIQKYEFDILPEWLRYQLEATTLRRDLLNDDELRDQSRRFLGLFRKGLQSANGEVDINGEMWGEAREMLADISRSRARQGFSPSETAT